MGYVKIVAPEVGRVQFVHQLNSDGTPYAEDVVIEAQAGVPASRVDWTDRDGQVGTLSWGFSPASNATFDPPLRFPEEDA